MKDGDIFIQRLIYQRDQREKIHHSRRYEVPVECFYMDNAAPVYEDWPQEATRKFWHAGLTERN